MYIGSLTYGGIVLHRIHAYHAQMCFVMSVMIRTSMPYKLSQNYQVLRGQRNGCSEDVKYMILLLLSYFDEKEELLHYVEETSLAKDVELENLPVTPCIIVCGKYKFSSYTVAPSSFND
ncbi:hypothetical protein QTP86_029859 [Hemibagrus guttatus]|nr:hypothetical protein QTP86_029859 [Hemibagrus guttatus]